MTDVDNPISPSTLDGSGERPRHLKRNFTVLFVHGIFGQTGFRLLQAPTFLPTYLHLLTNSGAAVGAARAVQSLGMFASPLFGVGAVQSRSRVKSLTLLYGSIMRVQVLLVGLIALLAPTRIATIVIWPVLLAWGLGTGLQMVAFNFLLAKTVPVQMRGRLLGARNLVSGLTVVVVAALAGIAIDRYHFPTGYAVAFLAAFALTAVGLLSLIWLREEDTIETAPAPSPLVTLGRVPDLLRGDPSFSGYLQARLLFTTARGVLPFYVLHFGRSLGTSGSLLAGLTVVFTIAQAFWSVLWGGLGDRFGFVRVFIGALLCWIGASVATVVLAPRLTVAYGVFVLLAGGLSGCMLAGQMLALEFGTQRDRALRIATSNSLSELVGGIGFAAAGLFVELFSIPAVLVASIAFQLVAATRLSVVVEPRRRSA